MSSKSSAQKHHLKILSLKTITELFTDQSESLQVRQADLSGSPKILQILSIEVFTISNSAKFDKYDKQKNLLQRLLKRKFPGNSPLLECIFLKTESLYLDLADLANKADFHNS